MTSEGGKGREVERERGEGRFRDAAAVLVLFS